jgi:hypothetical protein
MNHKFLHAEISAKINKVWNSLDERGYAIVDEESIGISSKDREKFGRTYFNSDTLRNDEGDWPIDRERARDVIFYQWNEDKLELDEFETVTIVNRAGIEGKRDHARVRLLEDTFAAKLVRNLLALVPKDSRQDEGTFGINLFRTYTNVVTTPHQDHEQFVITYVIDRVGDGAETYLYRPEDVREDGEVTGEPILRQQLDPGQMIIFEDQRFKHGATPLVPLPAGQARRDAVICTVDYRETYLSSSATFAWVC